ncbi:hypothetical protein HYW94_02395 [Candidatus Uhrbacteria bacterium]|nr:hypothetical protein [Candidatus Uhrbacteria bacterium]
MKLLLRAPAAVDYYPDGAQNPENIKQYGYMACGEVFESDALKSEYRDMNTDGAPDIRLSGVTDVLCEEPTNFEGDVVKNWRQIKVTSWSVERVFLWQSELQQFREEKNG